MVGVHVRLCPWPDWARTRFTSSFNNLMVVAAIVAVGGAVAAFALVRQRDFVRANAPDARPPSQSGHPCFTSTGVSPQLAEQSWYIFGTLMVSWLAAEEAPLGLGETVPRFELFLGALLRGLPAREPGT